MRTHAHTSRRVGAVVGAMTLGLTTLVGTGAAIADDLALGNIDPDATGSIIIHKHESGSQTKPGTPDGTTTDTGGAPVADVLFTAYPITNLNLTSQAAWNGLAELSVPADACGADFKTPSLTLPGGTAAVFGAGIPADAKTDDNGAATISDLSVQAYLVCETEAPATVAKKAAPFLVTVPFPNNTANNATSGNGEWLYNVNVYPKNTVVLAPTKGVEVTASGLQTADQVSFPVTAKIPSIATDESFKYFVISDPLDSNLENGKVASVKVGGADVTPASHYVVTTGQTPSVGFTQAGLEYLKAHPNETIEVVFTATVKSVPANGVIENVANLYVDVQSGSTPPDTPPTTPPDTPPTPTNKVVTTWGNLVVLKKDVDNEKALAGAAFQVYNAKAPYAASCAGAEKDGDPIAINGETSFVSDSTGKVDLAGLFVDKKQGEQGEENVVPDHDQRCYVLVETAAPAGYVLPAGADAETAVTVKAGQTAAATWDAQISNTKQDVPGLPLTGANGQLLMTLGGLMILLVAGGSVMVVRSRRSGIEE